MIKNRILVVEDQIGEQKTLCAVLEDEGYEVIGVGDGEHAIKETEKYFINLAIVDIRLPGINGLEVMEKIHLINEETMIIIATAYDSIDTTLTALNKGAYTYLIKPFNLDKLKLIIKGALEKQRLSLENKILFSELTFANKKLDDLARTDELTGLFNHRHFNEKLEEEFTRAKRYLKPLSLIMIDIDYFKCINDAYGHPFGDFILKKLADILKKGMRTNDIVARYGGEEFVVILPETDSTGAIVVCQEIWEEVENYFFEKEKHKVKIEISLGTASFPEDGITSEEDLLKYADTALYRAKEKGGNCICSYNNIKPEKEIKESDLCIEPESKINGLKARLHTLQKSINATFSQASHALASAIEVKDMYSYEHINNVILWAMKIAKEMGLTEREIEMIKLASLLHDIGKIGISDTILLKPGKLDNEEFEIMKKHSQIAIDILKSVRLLREEIPLILHHHEWFDGSGYPDGLKDKEIPMGARIIAVSDVYGALISNRSYRDALSHEKALEIIKERSGSQFDPEIVNVFLKIVKK